MSVVLEAREPDVPAWRTAEVDRHLDHQVRLWLGLPVGNGHDVPRLPSSLALRLLRLEEYEEGPRDRWGCFEFGGAESFRSGRLWLAEVDEWLAARRQELAEAGPLEPLWPHSHRFAVCMTHDVDMLSRQMTPTQAVRGLRAAVGPMPEGREGGLTGRAERRIRAAGRAAYYGIRRTPATEEMLQAIVDVERELAVTGTYLFTVVPEKATPWDCVYDGADPCFFDGRPTTIAAVIRTLVGEGFDLGVHGSYGSALDSAVLARERERVSDLAGAPVTSTRQHYLHFDIRRTPGVQEAAGLTTDSTLGFNRNIGFRAGTSLPFQHFDLQNQRPLNLLEVPLIVHDLPLLMANALELGRELAERTIAQMIDKAAELEGAMTFLFHPHTMVDPDFRALYRFALEYGLEQGAWVANLREIDGWWRDRTRRLTQDDSH